MIESSVVLNLGTKNAVNQNSLLKPSVNAVVATNNEE